MPNIPSHAFRQYFELKLFYIFPAPLQTHITGPVYPSCVDNTPLYPIIKQRAGGAQINLTAEGGEP